MTVEMAEIIDRVRKLEAENKRLGRAGLALVLVSAGLFAGLATILLRLHFQERLPVFQRLAAYGKDFSFVRGHLGAESLYARSFSASDDEGTISLLGTRFEIQKKLADGRSVPRVKLGFDGFSFFTDTGLAISMGGVWPGQIPVGGAQCVQNLWNFQSFCTP